MGNDVDLPGMIHGLGGIHRQCNSECEDSIYSVREE